ncbi:hypothetical protein [Serratia proteamaculans]|uniref:hypothetical protein n=1 Tax=Serratia proteamaculans TaxID=28151 RepID=UPI003D07F6EC
MTKTLELETLKMRLTQMIVRVKVELRVRIKLPRADMIEIIVRNAKGIDNHSNQSGHAYFSVLAHLLADYLQDNPSTDTIKQ